MAYAWTGDGDRGRIQVQTVAEDTRCEAPAEAGKEGEPKGRKRHRGRKGSTAQGKRQKGGVPPSGAEGSTGIGVAGNGSRSGKLKRKKKQRGQAGHLSGEHIAMRGSQKTEEKTATRTAKREGCAGDEELEWAEPISEEAKLWVSQHFEGRLLRDHGGSLTQEAACAMTKKDKKLQRYVLSEGLGMRPSDVAWAWVAQQVMDGTVADGEILFRPEIGSLAEVEEQVLWQWVARAVTGWEVKLRRAMSRKMLARMVLSRQLLKSTYRVREKRLAAEWGMTTGEVFDIMGESTVEMTKGLSAAVWKNAHKQAGFAETGGVGWRRFWACMHMFREEGKVVDRGTTQTEAGVPSSGWPN